MRPPIVAIDGPAGSGKSTLASRLAGALGVPYVNTGAMYRAVTRRAIDEGLDLDDGEALAELARRIGFELSRAGSPPGLTIDGELPSPSLSRADVEAQVSRVAAHPALRLVLRQEQRRLGRAGGVLEGRDIGSVVFPEADVKIFLAAAERERVSRRTRERRGPREDEMRKTVLARDARDERVNPFVPAADATTIDTTDREPDEVFREALALVERAHRPAR